MDNRQNNFDFLRLLFASFVIITHSYPLSGRNDSDFLHRISHGQIGFSIIGLMGFFVVSGYLVFQSLQRSDNIIDFFWKRFLRLFPALFIVLLLTVILSPFVYQGDGSIYHNKSLITYIPNNLLLYRTQFIIKGIFENNPYKSNINGSLWTIPYEFTLYILLSFLIVFRRKKIIIIQIILSVLFLILFIGNIFYFKDLKQFVFNLNSKWVLEFGAFFIAGSLLAAIKIEKFNRKNELLVLTFLLIIAAIYFDFYNYLKYIAVPILFVLFGLNPIPFIYNIGNRIGDLSYGIYIYGFPIQQTLMYYFKLNYLELMIYSLMISFIFAYFSWHYIEKRSLKLKTLHLTQVMRLAKIRVNKIKTVCVRN